MLWSVSCLCHLLAGLLSFHDLILLQAFFNPENLHHLQLSSYHNSGPEYTPLYRPLYRQSEFIQTRKINYLLWWIQELSKGGPEAESLDLKCVVFFKIPYIYYLIYILYITYILFNRLI